METTYKYTAEPFLSQDIRIKITLTYKKSLFIFKRSRKESPKSN